MGLLKHFRSKSHLRDAGPKSPDRAIPYMPARYGRDFTTRLPDTILERTFSYVCPHTLDETYEPSERSQIGDGCMLCDLRDLAHSAQVSRKWYRVAQKLLYTSVRIDAVHYCALEEELAERRRKAAKHFRSKSSVEAGEVPNIRLSLLARTVRESATLASQVLFLKVPYMTRETSKGDLARAVSALPNLRYVDLPEGFFTGDPSCYPLRQELQSRCPDIRKMSYRAGSEEALELLAQRYWQNLEMLEISSLAIEPVTLRIVLGCLPTLHDLTLSDLDWIDDTIFHSSPGQLPDFPPLQTLKLEDTPRITAEGIKTYLEAPHCRENLSALTLSSTGVLVQDIHTFLWSASSLAELSISAIAHKSLGLATADLQPLTSISLHTLHYEITSSEDVHGLQKPAESYYAYLANSLHSNSLPGLTILYVRDPQFPELLLLPPKPPLPTSHTGNSSLNSKTSTHSSVRGPLAPPSSQHLGPPQQSSFSQTLEVFSKGLDETEWLFTSITPAPPSANRRGSVISGGRPLSAYSASRGLGPQWAQGGFGGEARKSVIVGNGFGGFLAVPSEEVPRPLSREGRWGSGESAWSGLKPPPVIGGAEAKGHARKGSKHDLWR
nr:hypothetical protein B0A51_04339 [Rachicladosporium sp. CCFEE 5018]